LAPWLGALHANEKEPRARMATRAEVAVFTGWFFRVRGAGRRLRRPLATHVPPVFQGDWRNDAARTGDTEDLGQPPIDAARGAWRLV
jgi:hypothetical protein